MSERKCLILQSCDAVSTASRCRLTQLSAKDEVLETDLAGDVEHLQDVLKEVSGK